jgi:amidohydrolase
MTFDLDSWVPPLYESLHRRPELGMHEHETAKLLASRLEHEGYDVRRGVGGTGVVARLRRGPGPTICARAELDALPILEATGCAFASVTTGVMHACGHDLHLASLVSAAAQLAVHPQFTKGELIIILQPGEELGLGAAAMLDDDLRDLVESPSLLLGQHVTPHAPVGAIVSTPGTAMAAVDTLRITVQGAGGHSSAGGNKRDPVNFVISLSHRLQTIVGRDIGPFDQAVVTIPSIDARSAPGVRALTAEITLSIRTISDRVRESIFARIEQLLRAEAIASDLTVGADGDVQIIHELHVPAVINEPRLLAAVAHTHRENLSLRHISVQPAMASDDFSVLGAGLGCPSAFWFIGSGAPGSKLGYAESQCHTNRYLPHPSTLALGASAMREAILAGLTGHLLD